MRLVSQHQHVFEKNQCSQSAKLSLEHEENSEANNKCKSKYTVVRRERVPEISCAPAKRRTLRVNSARTRALSPQRRGYSGQLDCVQVPQKLSPRYCLLTMLCFIGHSLVCVQSVVELRSIHACSPVCVCRRRLFLLRALTHGYLHARMRLRACGLGHYAKVMAVLK